LNKLFQITFDILH